MNINKSVHFTERLGPWRRSFFEVRLVIAVSVDGDPRVTTENRWLPHTRKHTTLQQHYTQNIIDVIDNSKLWRATNRRLSFKKLTNFQQQWLINLIYFVNYRF